MLENLQKFIKEALVPLTLERSSEGPVRSFISQSRSFLLLALGGTLASACQDITNNNYEIHYDVSAGSSGSEGSDSGGGSDFLDPSECGVAPNIEHIQDMTPFAFYGESGPTISVLMDADNYKLLNENLANGVGDWGGDYVHYTVEGGEGTSDDALATVCITSPDGTETACVEGASVVLAGSMTSVQWCGDGVGDAYEEEDWWASCGGEATIPVLNIDLNQTDPDAKISDTVTGKEIDNIRINSGQYLGLARAKVAYDLMKDMGNSTRATTYVNVMSNVYGLNGEGTGCIQVPQLNMMRDQDGLACEYNEDTLDPSGTLDCDHGFEGYSLDDAQCEWSETEDDAGEPVCDDEQLDDFAETVNTNAYTSDYTNAISAYVEPQNLINHMCAEFVEDFWDGIRVGNNFVSPCLSDGETCKYGTIPYSLDYALLPGEGGWYESVAQAVGGWQGLTMSLVEDPSSCQQVVDTCTTMVDALEANCSTRVAEAEAELKALDMWRSPDETVILSMNTFCSERPASAREVLAELQAYCDTISSGSVDTGISDTGALADSMAL